MGMTNFLSRFKPHYSQTSYALLELTKKDVPWTWESKHEESFQNLKSALSSSQVMTYYDAKKQTTLVTDAGPTGLSAILL